MTKDCDACGQHLEFITGPSGRPFPAQKVKSVYMRLSPNGPLTKIQLDGPAYINHFETCPDPDRFSKT